MAFDANTDRPWPGGCVQLLTHYRSIGTELLKFEQSTRAYGCDCATAMAACRAGLVFIPTEVIEAYLDSLLDLKISEETLFVYRHGRNIGTACLSVVGLLSALAVGLYAASSGASLLLSFALTVCLAVPFAVLWHYYPKSSLARRMLFAKVLSEIIGQRRGQDKEGRQHMALTIENLLGRQTSGALPGAARTLLH